MGTTQTLTKEKDLFPTYEEAQALIPKMLEDQQIYHDAEDGIKREECKYLYTT